MTQPVTCKDISLDQVRLTVGFGQLQPLSLATKQRAKGAHRLAQPWSGRSPSNACGSRRKSHMAKGTTTGEGGDAARRAVCNSRPRLKPGGAAPQSHA